MTQYPHTPTEFSITEGRRLYDVGYWIGYGHGEADARMSDASFVEAVVRRARALDRIEGEVSSSIRAAIAGMDAEAYRARRAAELAGGEAA